MHVFAGICWNVLLFATGAEEGGDACCEQGEKKTLCLQQLGQSSWRSHFFVVVSPQNVTKDMTKWMSNQFRKTVDCRQ